MSNPVGPSGRWRGTRGFRPPRRRSPPAPDRQRAWWFTHGGVWYANAVMVTLVALGLVDRARLGQDADAPLGFRLTDLGRAVFGAPEIIPPPEPAERRCLVIQPNFDIVAYLDQADARTAASWDGSPRAGIGPLGPHPDVPPHPGQRVPGGGERSGPHPDRRFPPAARPARASRQRVALARRLVGETREPVTPLLGSRCSASQRTAERDEYLKGHPDGTACGERFVIASTRDSSQVQLSGSLGSDHLPGSGVRWSWTSRAFFIRPTDRPRTGCPTATDRSAPRPDGLAAHDRLDAPGGRQRFETGRGPLAG